MGGIFSQEDGTFEYGQEEDINSRLLNSLFREFEHTVHLCTTDGHAIWKFSYSSRENRFFLAHCGNYDLSSNSMRLVKNNMFNAKIEGKFSNGKDFILTFDKEMSRRALCYFFCGCSLYIKRIGLSMN